MNGKNNNVEIFNNYESKVVSTPLSIMKCNEQKLVDDFFTSYSIDAKGRDSKEFRYVLARLFWFLLIHYSTEKDYPKLYKFFSKITNEVIVVNIRSLADQSYEYYRDKKKNIDNPNEWYGLLRNKLMMNDLELPSDVHDMASSIDIEYHLDMLESQLTDDFVNDDNILITLRGLYNVHSSYLAIGIIVPLSNDYIQYMDSILEDEYKDSITCYIQYSDNIMDKYIRRKHVVETIDRKYNLNYPVSILYKDLIDPSIHGLCEISFQTKVPYKKIDAIESKEYEVTDIALSVYGRNNETVEDMQENENGYSYNITIQTTNPELVLNFFKVKDILPNEVYLRPIDPIGSRFYKMVEKINLLSPR